MANLIDTNAMLASLVGVRADFTELAERFKVLAAKQSELVNLICGETDWEFDTNNEFGAKINFTDEMYVEYLTELLSHRDPISQMESVIRLVDKLADVIESCENKIDKMKDRINLVRKQDADYKNNNEYKNTLQLKNKLNKNALVLVDRYYALIKLFYKGRRIWIKRMTGLTESFVFKCKSNQYLIRNKVRASMIDQKKLFDDILNLDNQLNLHGV